MSRKTKSTFAEGNSHYLKSALSGVKVVSESLLLLEGNSQQKQLKKLLTDKIKTLDFRIDLILAYLDNSSKLVTPQKWEFLNIGKVLEQAFPLKKYSINSEKKAVEVISDRNLLLQSFLYLRRLVDNEAVLTEINLVKEKNSRQILLVFTGKYKKTQSRFFTDTEFEIFILKEVIKSWLDVLKANIRFEKKEEILRYEVRIPLRPGP